MRGKYLAPFLPSSIPIVREMLNVADITYGDRVYDLGYGDGRFLFISVRPPYNAKAVGIELNKKNVAFVERHLENYDLNRRIETIAGDARDYSISGADIVTLYLTTKGNFALKSMLEEQLKGSARVVSHDFPILGWNPSEIHNIVAPIADFGPLVEHTIYLYEMNKIRERD